MKTHGDSEAARLLREGRAAAGLEIEAASLATRIPTDQILAFEEGRYEALPAAPYARAFARTLAQAYGMDVEEVTAAVLRDFDPAPPKKAEKKPSTAAKARAAAPAETTPPPAAAPSSSRGPVLLILFLLVAMGALIVFTRMQDQVEPVRPPLPVAPPVLDTLLPPPEDTASDSVPLVATTSSTVTLRSGDSAVRVAVLTIREGRMVRTVLQHGDSLVLDPDTSTHVWNLSQSPLVLLGPVRADSLPFPYFRLDRRNDSVVVTASPIEEWNTQYLAVMEARRRRAESR